MSINALFNHRIVVHREVTTRDEYGDVIQAWSALPAPAGSNARPDQAWSGVQQDHGPGEQQGARRRWFLHGSFDVAERDTLVVEAGLEAPVLLRVVSVTPQPTRIPTAHHIEVNVEVWHGELTLAVAPEPPGDDPEAPEEPPGEEGGEEVLVDGGGPDSEFLTEWDGGGP